MLKREATDVNNQYIAGLNYENGWGVPQDFVEAAKWYQRAADQGHLSAQYMLGHIYEKGRGVLKDDIEAVKWWRLAAEQSYLHAHDIG